MAGGTLGAIVNRQALANTPSEVFNGYVFLMAATLALSGALHGANTSNISGILAMSNFKKTFHFSSMSESELSNIKGWVTSVIVLGGLVGALTSSPFNDRLGRRWTLFINAVIYSVGTIVQLVANGNINQVIGARAMQGFASGAGTVVGTLYMAGIAPKAIRGLLGAFFSTHIMFGVALGYWSNYISILHINPNSHWSWRFPTLLQIYPGVLLLIVLPFCVESPRWLVTRGRDDEALKALCKLRKLASDHPYVLEEFGEISNSVGHEKELASSSSWMGLVEEMRKDRTLVRRFILVMIVQLGFNFSGGNSITYYQTSILSTIGVASSESVYLFSGIYGLMKVLAVLIYAFLLSERFGRRRMLLVGSAINIICVLYLAVYLGKLSGHNEAAGRAAIAFICIFAIGYGFGWAPVAFGLNGEVFPNRLRAKIMSLTIGMQYLANFLLTRFFPNMVATIGSYGPFAIFTCVSAAIWIYVFFAMPETKGLAIEHMATLFGHHWFLNGIRKPKLNTSAQSSDVEGAVRGGGHLDGDEKATEAHLELR